MLSADRLRAKAREYELNALAQYDRACDEGRRSGDVFSAVALVLHELAAEADLELDEAA